jgi:amidase
MAGDTHVVAHLNPDLVEATISDLQGLMQGRHLTAHELVRHYSARIATLDRAGPQLRAILEVNPDALAIAEALDAERATRGVRGPLHGIPILLKDNIDTADTLLTTAGSLALRGTRPRQDAFVAQQLRTAGAIVLGKTNLTEWANFRSPRASSGWSARGGQGRNPYALDRTPSGSSSGSAQAVAANLTVVALATETDGSIVHPAHANGIVGLKPTVGLTSRGGVIPVAHSQDSVGVHARTVRDAAIVLGTLTGLDPRDPATHAAAGRAFTDYTPFLDPNGLRGARLGVPRRIYFGYSRAADAIAEAALRTMAALGAEVVDPAEIATAEELKQGRGELEVLLYEFKADLNAYLATRAPDPRHGDAPDVRTLADVIAFNRDSVVELQYFGQEYLEQAEAKGPLTEAAYRTALATNQRLARTEGLDAVLDRERLDALVVPTRHPAWPTDLINGDHVLGGSATAAAMAGYPLITVPAGYVHGLPVGITLMGRAYSEPTLLKLAYAFEQATRVRQPPDFRPTVALDDAAGGVGG